MNHDQTDEDQSSLRSDNDITRCSKIPQRLKKTCQIEGSSDDEVDHKKKDINECLTTTMKSLSVVERNATPTLVTTGSQSQLPTILSRESSANTVTITPRQTDILFGAKYMYHPGSIQLQQMVSKQLPMFESIVHRAEKTKFVGTLVQHIKASGVRFLAMDLATDSWIEVDDKIARNKVSKAFRNKRRTTGIGPSFFDS